MKLLRDEEREEDELLPDWTERLAVPALPAEKTGGAEQTERAADAGTETEGLLAGTGTERPLAGTEAEGPLAGAETEGSLARAETEGPLAGAETEGPLAGTETEGPLAGAETEGPLAGMETEGPLAGMETEGPLAGTEKKGMPSGPDDWPDVRSAEIGAWNAPDGMPGLGRMEDEAERPNKPKNDGENGYSGTLNGGIWLDGTAERRRLDGMPAPDGLDGGAGELEPGAALDGLARALGSSGSVLPEAVRRDAAERAAGADWPDGTASEIPTGWAQAGPEGAKAFAELDKAARAETDSGVEWLYRQTVRAEWQTAPAAGAVSAARLAEPGSVPAALTVEELDRAVRRDSRRYDGEMSIF